jgi:hypothetical protein
MVCMMEVVMGVLTGVVRAVGEALRPSDIVEEYTVVGEWFE